MALRKYTTTNDISTHQLFFADSLENGAGYVRSVFDRDRIQEVVRNHYEVVTGQLNPKAWTSMDNGHLSCDRSCPDCLRNYSNRQFHHLLDWCRHVSLPFRRFFCGVEKEIYWLRYLSRNQLVIRLNHGLNLPKSGAWIPHGDSRPSPNFLPCW